MGGEMFRVLLVSLFFALSECWWPFSSPSCDPRPAPEILDLFEHKLERLIAGQAVAKATIRKVLARHYVHRTTDGYLRRPLVLHFAGPTSVGKSRTASIIADSVFEGGGGGSSSSSSSSSSSGGRPVGELVMGMRLYAGMRHGMDKFIEHLASHLVKCPRAVIVLDEIQALSEEQMAMLLQIIDTDNFQLPLTSSSSSKDDDDDDDDEGGKRRKGDDSKGGKGGGKKKNENRLKKALDPLLAFLKMDGSGASDGGSTKKSVGINKAVVILTSDMGTEKFPMDMDRAAAKELVFDVLHTRWPNLRSGAILTSNVVPFLPLSEEDLMKVVDLTAASMNEQLHREFREQWTGRIEVEKGFAEAAVAACVRLAHCRAHSARGIERLMDEEVKDTVEGIIVDLTRGRASHDNIVLYKGDKDKLSVRIDTVFPDTDFREL